MSIKGKAKCTHCGEKGSKARGICMICGYDTCGFCQSGSPLGAVHNGECRDIAFTRFQHIQEAAPSEIQDKL